jgi:hypothetical protein
MRRLPSRADAALALGEAERQGYAIYKKFVAATTESLLGSKDKLMASKIFPGLGTCPAHRSDA